MNEYKKMYSDEYGAHLEQLAIAETIEAIASAARILGYESFPVPEIKINNRLTSTAGKVCHKGENCWIEFSSKNIRGNCFEDFKHVVYHEVSHYILYCILGWDNMYNIGHGDTWVKVMRKVFNASPTPPDGFRFQSEKRCTPEKKVEHQEATETDIHTTRDDMDDQNSSSIGIVSQDTYLASERAILEYRCFLRNKSAKVDFTEGLIGNQFGYIEINEDFHNRYMKAADGFYYELCEVNNGVVTEPVLCGWAKALADARFQVARMITTCYTYKNKHNLFNRSQAIKIVGLEVIEKLDKINCWATNRITDGTRWDGYVEFKSSIEANEHDLSAYWYVEETELLSVSELDEIDWGAAFVGYDVPF
jgi:predicted SprT family Zn-dependent metalloprotease